MRLLTDMRERKMEIFEPQGSPRARRVYREK